MNNLILFANEFISYLLCFVIFIAVIIAATKIGSAIRVAKNSKISAEEGEKAAE